MHTFFVVLLLLGIKGQNEIIVCSGKVEGEVKTIERGKKGFGYDSMFYPKGYSESFAELNSLEKNKISHRGLALKKLMEKLN